MQGKKTFDTSLQDVVYTLDVGAGLKILRTSLYVVMLLVIILIYTATQFWGLKSDEAMYYGQLGRSFSAENGWVTKSVTPFSMSQIEEVTPGANPRVKLHPELIHAPAYPMVLSLFFRLFEAAGAQPFLMELGTRILPAEQWILLPLNHLFTMLTGWLVFSLGKHLFYREIGFLSMTLFFLSDVVWQTSISGLNLSMAIFFSVAAFHAVIVGVRHRVEFNNYRRFWIGFALSAFCAAIAFYTRFISLAIVPGIAIYLWSMCGKFRGGTRYILLYPFVVLLLVSPWLLRNYLVCGNPFGYTLHTALIGSPSFPDLSLLRDYENIITLDIVTKALKEKWVLNFSGRFDSVIPALGGGLIMSFFVTTFFYRFTRPAINALRNAVGISFLTTLFLAGFFSESSIWMLRTYWSFIILFGISFFYILLDRLDLGSRVYVLGMKCFFIGLAVIPLALRILPPHDEKPYPPYHAPIIQRVCEMMTPREVICTDMPWATAWYGDQTSILLPKDLDQYYYVNDYKQYMAGLYFTMLTKNRPFVSDLLDGSEQSWLPVVSGRIPPDFPLKAAVSLNRQDQIFISDRDRWSTAEAQESAQ